uniref:RC107 n=1 Tax=Ruegeria sp. PR1b TaxID=185588 RepID=Q8KW83_9RHOB|nr:RC107 [Ruegeria sp. PR1b]
MPASRTVRLIRRATCLSFSHASDARLPSREVRTKIRPESILAKCSHCSSAWTGQVLSLEPRPISTSRQRVLALRVMAHCRFREHEDKIVTTRLETANEKTNIQQGVQGRGGESGAGSRRTWICSTEEIRMNKTLYVGLDVHKDTIAVAVAEDGRGGEIRFHGTIVNWADAVLRLTKTLTAKGKVPSFCYEAGPCGYGIHRHPTRLGFECAVVSPSMIRASLATGSRPTGAMPRCWLGSGGQENSDRSGRPMKDKRQCET